MWLLYVPSRQEHFWRKVYSCVQSVIWTCMYRCNGRFLLTCIVDEAEAANNALFSLHGWRQTGNKNLGIRVDKCYLLFQFWKQLLELTTVSMDVTRLSGECRQSSSWNVTHYGLDCTKWIFFERLKEVLTINPSTVQMFRISDKQNCKMQCIDVEQNKTTDFVVILQQN